jgi:outer membrane murein-binding lipoprotein Lpp
MKKSVLKWLAVVALACVVSGCATSQPPEEIRSAVSVVNRYTAEYVTEANKALAESGRSDADRLIGMGMRLQIAADALDRWANGKEKEAAR